MTNEEKINKLKAEYENIEIPKELDIMVKNTINQNRENDLKQNKKKVSFMNFNKTGIAAAVIFAAFVSTINISPTIAQTLSEIPVIGSVVKVLTIKTYTVKEDNFEAKIEVPEISGLKDKTLEDELNKQFIEEGQREYDNFLKEIEEMKANGTGHKALETGYEVKTDNDSVLSIVYTKFEAMGSSDTQYKTYTIDKENKAVVSLNSLFKDDTYIDVISEYIKSQIREQMKKDENIIYFIDSTDMPEDNFDEINSDQIFYINSEGKLVILFNKYDIAPGYMGTPQFEIPTKVINDILLDRGLIK